MTPLNWTLKASTINTWVDLASGPAIIRTIIVSNNAATAAIVRLRIATRAGIERAIIVPGLSVAAADSTFLDLTSQLNLGSDDVLQVSVSVAGVHALASGEVISKP